MSIVNLNNVFEEYARLFFKQSERKWYQKIGRKYGWKDLRKEIDWKSLK